MLLLHRWHGFLNKVQSNTGIFVLMFNSVGHEGALVVLLCALILWLSFIRPSNDDLQVKKRG